MRAFELIVALFIAAVVFVALKLLGLLIKFAAVAALIGFLAGLFLARAFRRTG